ncbi:MAG: tetratricopeptide repeat protein [Deltaproteobacteria bacterium]|nr:tetratricopeptide repeat protein [Deltaproteobacteria bacterium]
MSITDLFSIGNTFWMGLANHLWQSTLFAIGAWLIILFLKKNRARIRYWVWFSVSIKLLVPFSLFISFGSFIAPEWVKTQVEITPQLNIINTINQPFNLPEMEEVYTSGEMADASTPVNNLPITILAIWGVGALALIINWHKRVIKVSNMARKAEPLNDKHWTDIINRIKQKNRISKTIKLASTRDMMEPGVFGILRPVLFLPEEVSKHINDNELEAILIHEFEHIRCRDNLIAFIHMIVQALFWFHPIVWLSGSMLTQERELACDEAVLQSGKDPKVYAEGILKVCEHFLKSPSICVAGVIGYNLKDRIEVIIKNKRGYNLSNVKKIFLSIAGISMLGVPLTLGMITTQPGPVKPSDSELNKSIDEYKPDDLQVSGIMKKSNESSSISDEQDKVDLSVIPNEGTILKTVTSDERVVKKESFSIVKSDARIQTAKNIEKKTESLKVVKENALDSEAKDGIAVAQNESMFEATPVEAATPETMNIDTEREDADTYTSKGLYYLKKGQNDDAVAAFNKAIEINPGNIEAYVSRGITYYLQGKNDKAISDFNKAIEINPEFVVAYQNRGHVYSSTGNYEKALSDYSKVISLKPDDPIIYNMRGILYLKQGKTKNAIADYNKAIEINPEFTVAYQNRGYAYYLMGKDYKAISDYNKAIESNPENPKTYVLRGHVFYNRGMDIKATSDYNKALELDPDSEIAKIAKKSREQVANSERDKYYIDRNRNYSHAATSLGNPADLAAAQQAFDNWARSK